MAASDSFYNGLVTEINNILKEYGKLFTIAGKGTYNKATLTTSPGTPRTSYGVISTGATTQNLVQQIVAADVTTKSFIGKRTLLLGPAAAPEPGETVEVDGKRYSLDEAEIIKPADVALLYIVELSR